MKTKLAFLVAFLALGMGLFNVCVAPLETWDEARRGINALRMLQESDFWNYRYLDDWDTFNTKPPLFTWLVALSFKAVGVTKFALRLPSLLALIAYLLLVFRFITFWKNERLAWLVIWILLLTKGIVGYHVALNGDTDMLFVLLLTFGLLAAFRWQNTGEQRYSIQVVIGCTLAFLTKGLALGLVLPGLFTYLWIIHRRRRIKLSSWTSLASSLFGGGVVLLMVCVAFGRSVVYPAGIDNLLEAMFFQDGLTRFTDASFEVGYQWDFLLVALDIRFSPWIYLLYGGVLFAFVKGRKWIARVLKNDDLLLFSCLIVASVSSLLLLSQNKHQWYIAPMMLFLAYPVALVVDRFIRWKPWSKGLAISCFVLFAGLRAYDLLWIEDQTAIVLQEHATTISTKDTLWVAPHISQDLLFNFYLLNPDLRIVEVAHEQQRELGKGNCGAPIAGYCLELNQNH